MEQSDGSFKTARLVIRRFATDDWADIQALAKDKESSDGAIYDHTWPTSDDGCKGMAEFLSKKEFWAVCLKDDGNLIGLVSFNDVDEEGRLDLGHMFHTEYRRDGYDTEAIRCMLGVAFADPKIKSVIGQNAVEWAGQLTPLLELGFAEIGRGKGCFVKDDQGKDIEFVGCTMELTREAWSGRGDNGDTGRPR